MSGIIDHLHLKKPTAGSPSELSLDVLDAARSELDGKGRKLPASKPSSSPASGSYKGATGPIGVSGRSDGTTRPSGGGGHRKMLVASAIVVVVLGLVAVVTQFGLSYTESKTSFHESFRDVVHQLAQTDELLATLDEVMDESLQQTTPESRSALMDGIATARVSLQDARKAASQASEDIVTTQERQASEQFDSTVAAREEMLDAAESAIAYEDTLAETSRAFGGAWASVFEADQQARAATDQANEATTESQTQAARDATQAALNQMYLSQAELADAASKYRSVDVSGYSAYLEKRIEALEHAVATGDALLQGDRQAAQDENDAYNAADEEAAVMAADLPLSIEETVRAGSEEKMAAYRDAYQHARDTSAELDDAIASFLE